ncbi:uncharacterized protein LOC134549462 [Prinia subflava]|uniref:uncharacterized protein LOC134549462 n=1 Tax=Prinia subflava TaxID=208062 RepID=UPI002FE0E261
MRDVKQTVLARGADNTRRFSRAAGAIPRGTAQSGGSRCSANVRGHGQDTRDPRSRSLPRPQEPARRPIPQRPGTLPPARGCPRPRARPAAAAPALPAHAQGASNALPPLPPMVPARRGAPPSRPPAGWFLPGPISSSPSQQSLPPRRENTRPTNMAADKTAPAAPSLPQTAALASPPRPPAAAPPPQAAVPSPPRCSPRAALPSRCGGTHRLPAPQPPPAGPCRPPGRTHAVGAAEERLTDLPLRRCGRRSAGLMAEAPPVLPPGPASGSRGRASGRCEGRAARGGHPALGAGLLLPPGAAHS